MMLTFLIHLFADSQVLSFNMKNVFHEWESSVLSAGAQSQKSVFECPGLST
jgi:hypothetical protein